MLVLTFEVEQSGPQGAITLTVIAKDVVLQEAIDTQVCKDVVSACVMIVVCDRCCPVNSNKTGSEKCVTPATGQEGRAETKPVCTGRQMPGNMQGYQGELTVFKLVETSSRL